jgi:predicted KAP-like P-loop ATPase
LGSGKTSLINLVRERLAMTPELPVLDFNPWMFSGAEQLVDSFFAELAAQLRLKGGRFQRIAERLDSYGELLTPLSLLPVVGAWTERLRGTTGALKRYQDKRKHGVSERRQQLVDELVGLEQPIVVVLDDIDRLTTGEIRETFTERIARKLTLNGLGAAARTAVAEEAPGQAGEAPRPR